MDGSDRWVTLALTWNGLRALGVDDESLASFPDEFREGMAARADILGDTGAAAPEHWVDGLAGEDVHATPGSGGRWNPGSSSWVIPTKTGPSSIFPSRRCCRATAVTWARPSR